MKLQLKLKGQFWPDGPAGRQKVYYGQSIKLPLYHEDEHYLKGRVAGYMGCPVLVLYSYLPQILQFQSATRTDG